MPFDQPQGGGGGGEPNAQRWNYTLELPSIAGLTVVHMTCGIHVVEFRLDDAIPKGTVITVQIKEPVPLAIVSYALPSEDKGHMRVRVLTVPLR